jgi:hypothetical protein
MTPTMNFLFTITATLKGEDTTAFTGACTVGLSESAAVLTGELSKANSGGTATFSVYFLAVTSNRIITASCPASGSYPLVSTTITLTSLTLILKIGSFTPIVINN